MIGKDGAQAHGPRMQNGFMAKTTETSMTMHNLNLLTYYNVPKDWKKRKHRWKGSFAVDHEEGDVIDFEPVGQVPDTSPILICVSDDDYLVTTVNELGRELVNVGLNSTRLGEEEVANHGDVVRHDEDRIDQLVQCCHV